MASMAVIPQIVISASDEDRHGDKGSPRKGPRRGSLTGAAEAPESPGKGARGGGLAAPAVSRSRSRSLPNVMDPGLVLQLPRHSKNADHEDEDGEEEGHLQVLGPTRQRSNSWCPGKRPVLPKRHGSRTFDHVESPRPNLQRVPDGGARRRRMSLSTERLLRDLSLGIEHKEFASIPESSPVEEGLWKDLKKCRYLRKPIKKYQSSQDPDEVEPTLNKT